MQRSISFITRNDDEEIEIERPQPPISRTSLSRDVDSVLAEQLGQLVNDAKAEPAVLENVRVKLESVRPGDEVRGMPDAGVLGNDICQHLGAIVVPELLELTGLASDPSSKRPKSVQDSQRSSSSPGPRVSRSVRVSVQQGWRQGLRFNDLDMLVRATCFLRIHEPIFRSGGAVQIAVCAGQLTVAVCPPSDLVHLYPLPHAAELAAVASIDSPPGETGPQCRRYCAASVLRADYNLFPAVENASVRTTVLGTVDGVLYIPAGWFFEMRAAEHVRTTELVTLEFASAAPASRFRTTLMYLRGSDDIYTQQLRRQQPKTRDTPLVEPDSAERAGRGSALVFTADWFSHNERMWRELFDKVGWHSPERELHALEVGSWEGRSACWLLQNILKHENSTLHCIDTWSGSAEHTAAQIAGVEDFVVVLTLEAPL